MRFVNGHLPRSQSTLPDSASVSEGRPLLAMHRLRRSSLPSHKRSFTLSRSPAEECAGNRRACTRARRTADSPRYLLTAAAIGGTVAGWFESESFDTLPPLCASPRRGAATSAGEGPSSEPSGWCLRTSPSGLLRAARRGLP